MLTGNYNTSSDIKFTVMIEDIEVGYLGVKVKVTHSLYKPDRVTPGRIRYTFHLPTRRVTLWQLKDDRGEYYWVEIPGVQTLLAEELGAILENRYIG